MLSFIFILVLTIMVYFVTTKMKTANIEHYQAKYSTYYNPYEKEKPFLGDKKWRIINSYNEYKELLEDINNYILSQSISSETEYIDNDPNFFDELRENIELYSTEKEYVFNKLKGKDEVQKRFNNFYNEWYESIPKDKFNKDFFENNNLLIIDTHTLNRIIYLSNLKKFSTAANTAKIIIKTKYHGYLGCGTGVTHYIVVDKIINNIELNLKYKEGNL